VISAGSSVSAAAWTGDDGKGHALPVSRIRAGLPVRVIDVHGRQVLHVLKVVSAMMLASIAFWLAGCGGPQAAHRAAAKSSVAAISSVAAALTGPPQCGTVMATVRDVARKAGIDLATGSMNASVSRSMLADWSSELGNTIPAAKWKPTSAMAALKLHVRNAETAALRVTESQADAVRFIASLQKIAADCGQS